MPARTRSTISAFEFGDRSDDDDDGAAQRAARVDLLAEADELDVEPVQLVEHFEEVPGRAGDAIAGPDQDDIEAAAAGIPHQVIQTGPARLRAGDPVGDLRDDLDSRAGRPSGAGRRAGSPDADRRWRPSDKGRRVSPAPPLRSVLGDVVLDELHQDVGHVLPLGGGGRLEVCCGVRRVRSGSFVSPSVLLACGSGSPPSSEMSISGYE